MEQDCSSLGSHPSGRLRLALHSSNLAEGFRPLLPPSTVALFIASQLIAEGKIWWWGKDSNLRSL
jgi:hypothetical protein